MKLLVVEDDPLHAQFMLDSVSAALPEVTEMTHVDTGHQGVSEACQGQYPAVVLDLQIPGQNGVEVARNIWARQPATRILFWTNYADEAYLRGILRIVPAQSAYGYILKTASTSRLHLALRAVMIEGQIMVDPGVHRFQVRASATRDGLTDSEHNVLIDLAIGMTDKGIAQRRAMSVRSVQNRLLSIYQKLEVEEDDQGLVNKRARAVYRALVTRTINVETMIAAARALELWLEQRDQ
ncbi:DNA-binding NarL/FixJ family response regulator [Sagittula marina]|uniref:DNA-binding NarL/FixJ family response regulator n=2 Tax=Sagittula marina TaxID=943940 RepID=A0A7W6DMA7_9RHOB|nr:DNA-binding NarL/FixJ family response regulator [Sagittula marina]